MVIVKRQRMVSPPRPAWGLPGDCDQRSSAFLRRLQRHPPGCFSLALSALDHQVKIASSLPASRKRLTTRGTFRGETCLGARAQKSSCKRASYRNNEARTEFACAVVFEDDRLRSSESSETRTTDSREESFSRTTTNTHDRRARGR